ncbi:bifunctional 2-C-methyl-D-erythritol 4-phosphate cytidylyltransferase/2-C-methyl-D-erythritol 2,4-cyclodiphosphate synthase [Helicobacter sp. MIT 21-1697]|uniref:bifunctional 2-C-methyl-D-erythritol 4-phosphate cytidylyltransferase/2-C-methyl-D-erythritol 2,4-cyclodiphosphate synthase n=1 Tax=Helicobacter sp. MIT 21-1697 TaxID=2993733 RepID=UPI00224B7BD2|nr:bifunctional 2-C-methyl-D-erythritol 4-phosphate cytidylyltransferase/2-C-methyl-D-erythritol 2,4-cyclodiphosphate synthase [Helicobacter sp. MIT 21-1697]MCX2717665.1 bifunctional 2-C-methyl-D-erythritol 4-phosphate cytidylyltransferase/2-C-methyl-D-erythritol 2,4-cyclodiphosphate synthase [Helicobacter sp. MIT 21-1697]
MVLDNVSLIMMAAGDSTRFCASNAQNFRCKKQWLRVGEEPLWLVATHNLTRHFSFKQVILTASSQDCGYMQNISPYKVVQGGQTRCQSLRNALKYIDTPLVLVSDVARWDSSDSVIKAMLATLDENVACVVPFVGVADTSFYEGEYLKRENIKLIQTPQLSRVEDLREALKDTNKDFSDESSALYAFGKKIAFVQGSTLMNKLTFDSDLKAHITRLSPPSKKIFVGNGIDVHQFEEGKQMWLGGVQIESAFGFKAHSDGDVALHALSDAILGAIGGGDIGEWFPDIDETYKNADSKMMLDNIYTFAQSVGYELYNADISIIAQTPKIAPYKNAMRECIAHILRVPNSRINIKATTTERLGFIGRKEGICVEVCVSMGFADWHTPIQNLC